MADTGAVPCESDSPSPIPPPQLGWCRGCPTVPLTPVPAHSHCGRGGRVSRLRHRRRRLKPHALGHTPVAPCGWVGARQRRPRRCRPRTPHHRQATLEPQRTVRAGPPRTPGTHTAWPCPPHTARPGHGGVPPIHTGAPTGMGQCQCPGAGTRYATGTGPPGPHPQCVVVCCSHWVGSSVPGPGDCGGGHDTVTVTAPAPPTHTHTGQGHAVPHHPPQAAGPGVPRVIHNVPPRPPRVTAALRVTRVQWPHPLGSMCGWGRTHRQGTGLPYQSHQTGTQCPSTRRSHLGRRRCPAPIHWHRCLQYGALQSHTPQPQSASRGSQSPLQAPHWGTPSHPLRGTQM